MNNFIKRTISGVGFVAIMIAALLTNKIVFGAVMLFALVVMMWEFLRMTCGEDYKYSQILSIIAGTTLFVLTYMYKGFNLGGRFIILSFVPVFILMVNSLYLKDKSKFAKFANLYASLIYIAVPWTTLNFIAFSADGVFDGRILLCFFAIIWGSDVGAYMFGITLGQKYGKKLFPSISPKKSWIGFWGGMFMAVVVALLLFFIGVFPYDPAYKTSCLINFLILSIMLNIGGVYGDLIESQWKRHYKVKDSGTIIPGHGGMLDRFDSALIAIPIGVIYLMISEIISFSLI